MVSAGPYIKHCGGVKEAIADLKRRQGDLVRRLQEGPFGNRDGSSGGDGGGSTEMDHLTLEGRRREGSEGPNA